MGTSHSRQRVPGIALLLAYCCLTACGGGNGGSAPGPGAATKTATLNNTVKNVAVQSGVPFQKTFSYTIPGDITSRGDFSVNVMDTLQHVTLSSTMIADGDEGSRFETFWLLAKMLVKDAFAISQADVLIHVSQLGDPDVCSSPHTLGPYTLTGTVDGALDSMTTTVSPTQSIIDLLNAGGFEVCVEVASPPVDAYVTVDAVVVDFDGCDAPTENFVGTWSGTYSCDNYGVGDDPPGSPVSLTISRNPDGSYHYFDGEADYDGHVCGNTYRFSGGATGVYNESGTLVVAGNTASKTSQWQSVSSFFVGGSCQDSLARI
jgi:hypothetical protein